MTTGEHDEARLSAPELSRYSRHLALSDFGPEGQQALKQARVLIVGAGGLGSPLGLYLAAAGVGTIGIVDADLLEDNNLQRQVLYTVDDVGKSKAECAAVRLRRLNPYIAVEPYAIALNADNAEDLIRDYDLVIDGTDNFSTRYLINDACVMLSKPNIYGSILRFEGQASVFNHAGGPCYRCLYPEPPPQGLVPSCAEGGVLGVLPAIIASIQATEAIKILCEIGVTLSGRLLLYDALAMNFEEFELRRDPHCPMCGETPSIHTLTDQQVSCALDDSGSAHHANIDAEELQARLQRGEAITMVDVRDPYEREICAIADSLTVPLDQLADRIDEFDPGQMLVCYCKSGGRSAAACRLLSEAGFAKVFSLSGGILAWAETIEPDMMRY